MEYEEMLTELASADDLFCELIDAAARILRDDIVENGSVSAQARIMFLKELNTAADRFIDKCEESASELGCELSGDLLETVHRNLINDVLELTEDLIEKMTELVKES